MFTYNTMQTFIGVVGMQPLHMVAPPSDDPRRTHEFADELVGYLADMIEKDLKPRDIVVRDSIRNAVIVAMAIGGSTNVTLHAPEIARAAGYADFWKDIITPEEFNHLSQHVVPVLTDARPYGKYSMVDIDNVGGVQVIARELLDAGLLNGDVMTCTGETLAAQIKRLDAKRADGKVVYSVEKPYKPTGGLRVLGGNLSPDFSAILKLAGVEGGLEDNTFRGRARVFEGERGLLEALDKAPDSFQNHDMVIVRYEGPSGAPGMPEMLDPTSRITTLCRERNIVDRPDDRCPLLRRLGRPGHRPCRPRGGAGRSDRLHRGRRRDRGRPQQERAQLPRARRCQRRSPSARRPGTRRSPPTAASIPTAASPTRACCTVPAPRPCRPRAAAACTPTARSGSATRGAPSAPASSCRTSTGRSRTRRSETPGGVIE